MKKSGVFVFLISVFYIGSAFAFMYMPSFAPLPEFDASNDVVVAAKSAMKKGRTIVDQAQQTKDEMTGTIKSAGEFTSMGTDGSSFDKPNDEPNLPGARTIAKSNIADISDPASVASGFITINLTYPMELFELFSSEQREGLVERYNKNRVEFANDTMMELYLAVRDLEENRLPQMKSELETLSDCFVKGKDGDSTLCEGASSTEDDVGNWTNRYKLEALYDVYLRTYQELIAMKVMYRAAVALQTGLIPFNRDEALGIEAPQSDDKHVHMMKFEMNQSAGFAQMMEKNSLLSGGVMDVKEEKTEQAKSKKGSGLLVKSTMKFKEKTPFEGAEKNLQALPVLEGIYDLLSEAQFLHNTKQQMPNLRKPFIETEKMRKLHSVAIGKLVESEKDVASYFSKYYSRASDLWFGKGCKIEYVELGYACPNILGCTTKEEYTKTGKHMIICVDDMFQVTDYVKKRGLAKDTIERYRISKAEQVLDLDGENLGTAVVDFDADTNVPEADENAANDDETVSESDVEYAQQALREQSLNRWQIGAIAAQDVGTDMASGHSQYGLIQKYPLWADEKRFYDQYLREKYKNIELYFKRPAIKELVYDVAEYLNESLQVNQNKINTYTTTRKSQAQTYKNNNCYYTDDAGNRTYSSTCGNKADQKAQKDIDDFVASAQRELETTKKNNSNYIALSGSRFEDILDEFDANMPVEQVEQRLASERDAFEQSYTEKESQFSQARNEYMAELDEVMSELNVLKKEYSDLMGKKKSAETEAAGQEESIKLAEQKIKKPRASFNPKSMVGQAMQKKISKAQEAQQAFEEAKKKLPEIEKLEEEADSLREYIKEADANIAKLRKEYMVKAVDRDKEEINAMKEAIAERENAYTAIDLPDMSDASAMMGDIFDVSKQIVKTFQEHAIEEVRAAYQKIEGLGNQKYEYESYPQILEIHKQMLENIKKTQYASFAVDVGNLILTGNVTDALRDLINTTAFETDCAEIQCDEADAQYYVSLRAEPGDLKAPKPVFEDRRAPIREVFHFDATDYDAIEKTDARPQTGLTPRKNPQTTREAFLKMGREIPEIWRLILGPKGFVERDVDVTDILHANDVVTVPTGNVPPYMQAQMQQQKDPNDELSEAFLKAKGETPVASGVSKGVGELAVFLKYEDGLTFRDSVYDLIKYFDSIQDGKDVNEDEEKEKRKMFLTRNQVGDYLQFVDMEQTFQTQLSQLQVKMDEATETIENALDKALCQPLRKSTGYVKSSDMGEKFVSSEFISDTEVYQSVLDCLDQGKNMYISEALDLMKNLPPLNDFLQEKKSKLDNMVRVMQMDNDEVVQISDNTEPNGEFEEQIKTKKVDREVMDTYGDEADDAFENNKKSFEKPFLARYF